MKQTLSSCKQSDLEVLKSPLLYCIQELNLSGSWPLDSQDSTFTKWSQTPCLILVRGKTGQSLCKLKLQHILNYYAWISGLWKQLFSCLFSSLIWLYGCSDQIMMGHYFDWQDPSLHIHHYDYVMLLLTGMTLGLLEMRWALVTLHVWSSVHFTSSVNSTEHSGQNSSHWQSWNTHT